jgi:hypothetical protein
MFTADQLVAHLVGDYLLQSHWMATRKGQSSFAAAVHAICYTLPFVLITHSLAALAIICGTHFAIDRWRLARWVVWLKNWPLHYVPTQYGFELISWKPRTATGYPEDVPAWLAVWLLIIADNTLHMICNGLAIWLAA